jgi:hypothetical protein
LVNRPVRSSTAVDSADTTRLLGGRGAEMQRVARATRYL